MTTSAGSVLVPVSWITNQPAVSWIEYGTREYEFREPAGTTDRFFHAVLLREVEPHATYQYRIIAQAEDSGEEVRSEGHTFRAFPCGDDICSRENGESEFVCGRDCRRDSCNNVAGAYGLGQSATTARLASDLGLRFNMAYARHERLPHEEMERYELNSFVNLISYVYMMRLESDLDADATTIRVGNGDPFRAGERFTDPPIPVVPDGAVFSIAWEEVRCAGFDPDESAYVSCVRGYANTTARSHQKHTHLLAHAQLEEYLRSLQAYPRSGYYVLDDVPAGRNPLYLPCLRKMYQIIKTFDRLNPVLAGAEEEEADGSCASADRNWVERIKRNTGLGAFDGVIYYVYPTAKSYVEKNPGDEITNRTLDCYFAIFEEKLGYVPPFIGTYQGFVWPPLYPDTLTLDLVKSQIDVYARRGASAVGVYDINRPNPAEPTRENSCNSSALRALVLEANQYARETYFCPAHSVYLPVIISPENESSQPPTLTVRFLPRGSFASYTCELRTSDYGIGDLEAYEDIGVFARALVNARRDELTETTLQTTPEPESQYLSVRCWNGSAQNTSTIRIHVGASRRGGMPGHRRRGGRTQP